MGEVSDMRILIVGGGIGGLTLAHFLQKNGFSFDLIEKAPEWKAIGSGLTLTPNALRVLDRINLVPALLEKGNELYTGEVLDEKGKVLTRLDYSYLREKYGFSTIGIHRSALQAILVSRLPADVLRPGTTLQSVSNRSTGAQVQFSDGQTESYDLIVGADGMYSQMRTYCTGVTLPRYAGYAGWSFVVPNECDFPRRNVVNQLGKGRRFGVIPVGNNQLYCWASTQAPRRDPALRTLDYRGVQALMANMGGFIPAILSSIRPVTPLYLGDAEDIQIDQWYRNSIVLMGDAAHAITPNLGMGASMAIEDAWVLTQCLKRYDSVPDALLAYQLRRKSRVQQVHRFSYLAGSVGQWKSAPARLFRNQTLGMLSSSINEQNLEQLMMREV